MKGIREGAKAPTFKLQDKDGSTYGVGATKSDFTVLYFYPKDDTPGCTIEAQDFSKNLKDFKTRKATVIGVSGGDKKTKQKFCSKYGLTVPLVSDADFSVSRAYGAYGEKKFMGRAYKGIFRKTFIVDSKGTIARIFDSVKPEGHAREVLKALDELRRGDLRRGGAKAGATKTSKVATPKSAAKKPVAKVAKRSSSKKVTTKKAIAKKATTKKATAKKKTASKKLPTRKVTRR
jgi:peroxiredoxin Q/BCP